MLLQAGDGRAAEQGVAEGHPEAVQPREALRLHPADRAGGRQGPRLPLQDVQGVLRARRKAQRAGTADAQVGRQTREIKPPACPTHAPSHPPSAYLELSPAEKPPSGPMVLLAF